MAAEWRPPHHLAYHRFGLEFGDINERCNAWHVLLQVTTVRVTHPTDDDPDLSLVTDSLLPRNKMGTRTTTDSMVKEGVKNGK